MKPICCICLFCGALVIAAFGQEKKPDVATLIKQLKDPNKKVRQEAAEALGDLGPLARAAVPALVDAIRDDETGLDAVQAIAKIGTAAIPPLREGLKNNDWFICAESARMLGNFGPPAKQALP